MRVRSFGSGAIGIGDVFPPAHTNRRLSVRSASPPSPSLPFHIAVILAWLFKMSSGFLWHTSAERQKNGIQQAGNGEIAASGPEILD